MSERKKILEVFTAEFPFGKAESFLENEIPVLAASFESIRIHPLRSDKGVKRDLPSNVISLEGLNGRKDIKTSSVFLNNFSTITHILLLELRHCSNRMFFLKNLRHFNSLIIRAVYDAERIMLSLSNDPKDLVFHSYWMNDWALALAVLKYKGKISSFVFKCGGFDIYNERHPGNYLPFRYFIYQQAAAVYPNSKDAVNYIKGKNIFPEKISIQYLGTVDHGLNPFDPQAPVTIVSCSNVIPLKRVDLIARILKQVKAEIRWIHFGDGASMDELRSEAANLPANIKYEFRGRVTNKEVLEFYKRNSVNLFVTVSETESLPVSIQEAMSFGIPVIATNVGGISEAVTEATGILIDKDVDVQKTAELINGFASDKRNSAEFREGVRVFWMKNFEAGITYGRFAKELLTRE